MRSGDTSLGGAHGPFPNTSWSLIARLGASATTEQFGAIETLCRRYWKPLYQYVRIAWAKTNDDAKDLTQAFFLWLMDGEALRKFAPERGGFRAYLKLLLKRFVGHHDEAMRRLKRGGDVKLLPLQDLGAMDVAAQSPEGAFDRAWFDEVVEQAIERVRLRFATTGREQQFAIFESHDLAGDGESHADRAARLGLTERAVRSGLFAVREAIRAEIRSELAELTLDETELDEEWNALFGK